MALAYACAPMTTEELMSSFPGCECDYADLPPPWTMEDVIVQASDAVWLYTNGTIGICTLTVRPTRDDYLCPPIRSFFDLDVAIPWDRYDGIALPGPAATVAQVKINGAIIPSSEYRIVNGSLVRVDGWWPADQNIFLADTEQGTFSITFTHGSLPLLAQMAATEVACSLARWLTGTVPTLPPGVTYSVMDGVSISIDPENPSQSHTPWLSQLVNAYGSGQAGEVWSPEIEGAWRLNVVS